MGLDWSYMLEDHLGSPTKLEFSIVTIFVLENQLIRWHSKVRQYL